MNQVLTLEFFGPLCFGLVIGWLTYRTVRHTPTSAIGDISSVVGAVGGAGVTTLVGDRHEGFYPYCIGLAIGFFAYAIFGAAFPGVVWLGQKTAAARSNAARTAVVGKPK
jgi:hypothetical protein